MAVNNEDRKRIIMAYLDGKDEIEISNLLQINRNTIHTIIKIYLSEGRIDAKPRGGTRRKSLEPEDKNFIKNLIDENCSITINSIKDKLHTDLNKEVSRSTITRAISNFEYTYKMVCRIPEKRNDETVFEIRKQYAMEYMRLLTETNQNKILFIDEVGFNITMRSRKGRSKKNTRAIQIVKNIRSRNISVCCCLSINGIVHYKTQDHAFNEVAFYDYIKELLEILQSNNPNSKYVLIMDNVPFHKNAAIKDLIIESGHNLKLLPPYSLFLNPIENMFSKSKNFVKQSRVNNEEELIIAIRNSFQNDYITSEDCEAYYRHMFGFIAPCIDKQPIIDE